VRSGSLLAWRIASRPGSFAVALSPVLAGAALGYLDDGGLDSRIALLVALAAILMQLITNLQNDVGYTVRGAERADRTGLPRATARGWLSVREVRAAIVLSALLAAGLGLALVACRGWPVLLIGFASLAAALAYMGGPRPIAYTPFGELTVFVFFGLVAVTGTRWVLTGGVDLACVLAATSIGGLAAAALALNNHRDRAHDQEVGRRTFAVRFGERASRGLIATLLLAPFFLTPLTALAAGSVALLLPLILVPAASGLLRRVLLSAGGAGMNPLVFRAFRLELGYAGLVAAGAVAARFIG